MGRRLELDAVRGLMLVWMALTHLPTVLPTYTNQPFGFVSASEGFIFLSALFTGRIYFRLAQRDGYLAMRRKIWMRTLRLYGYHVLLLAFAFLVAGTNPAPRHRPWLSNLFAFFFSVGAEPSGVEVGVVFFFSPLRGIHFAFIFFLCFSS